VEYIFELPLSRPTAFLGLEKYVLVKEVEGPEMMKLQWCKNGNWEHISFTGDEIKVL